MAQRSPVITVAHEGSHVADYQAYLAGTGSDVPLFFTENRAYFVSSYMAESLGLKSYYPGADEKTQVSIIETGAGPAILQFSFGNNQQQRGWRHAEDDQLHYGRRSGWLSGLSGLGRLLGH